VAGIFKVRIEASMTAQHVRIEIGFAAPRNAGQDAAHYHIAVRPDTALREKTTAPERTPLVE